MAASLNLPPRLTQGDFIARSSDRLDWQSSFYLAGLVTMALSPVVYVGVLAGATAAGYWGL